MYSLNNSVQLNSNQIILYGLKDYGGMERHIFMPLTQASFSFSLSMWLKAGVQSPSSLASLPVKQSY